MSIKPLPLRLGVGFVSSEYKTEWDGPYRYEKTGIYHNYFFTPSNWAWPEDVGHPYYCFDAFSPNLNKYLHVGHLRQLAIANSLHRIYQDSHCVSMLGASGGILSDAESKLQDWFDFVGFQPYETHYDTELTKTDEAKKIIQQCKDGEGEYQGCKVWTGPKGPVVLIRSNEKPTYAFHDLCFKDIAYPHYYLTGLEQREHFESLGLGEKHLAMGLVLDPQTGKKIKSRDGNAMTAEEALAIVQSKLNDTPEIKKLAWNIIAYNMLKASRSKNVTFDVDEWTKAESPGMYITYTLARIYKALASSKTSDQPERIKAPKPDEIQASDMQLLGTSSYLQPVWIASVNTFDPSHIATYTHNFARLLGSAYHGEKISDGRNAHRYAVLKAAEALEQSMYLLGMFRLTQV